MGIMKYYIAIGHWGAGREEITSMASGYRTMRDFRSDLVRNGFTAYVILTEKRFEQIKEYLASNRLELDMADTFELIKGLTRNYRIWNLVTEYIEQCDDIMQQKLDEAKELDIVHG